MWVVKRVSKHFDQLQQICSLSEGSVALFSREVTEADNHIGMSPYDIVLDLIQLLPVEHVVPPADLHLNHICQWRLTGDAVILRFGKTYHKSCCCRRRRRYLNTVHTVVYVSVQQRLHNSEASSSVGRRRRTWKLTPVTATEDNNDGRQSDSSPAGAAAFLNRPSAAWRRSLKDTSTLTYRSVHDNLARTKLKRLPPFAKSWKTTVGRGSRDQASAQIHSVLLQ
ncbi:hypothetical protein F2P81_006690 [Scophthalmus maximus]|uniref:Uncharacterized protein n=1 Tax=Scophthalmus maximus TaxID=52904 RepID=A0A6A4TF28_SCOMX|nr:hypothetical protein F2P81_006690 [Scophthalmus maximus]